MIDKLPAWFKVIRYFLIGLNAITFIAFIIFGVLALSEVYINYIVQVVLLAVVCGVDLLCSAISLLTLLIYRNVNN